MMRNAHRYASVAASLVLLLAGGCDLGVDRVVPINYDYFDLQLREKPDDSLVLDFTYTGPDELRNVQLYPHVFLARESLAWMPSPVWQHYERWAPGETKTITTDERYLTKKHLSGLRIPVSGIKLILSAERDGKTVYVTKEFKASL